MIKEAIVNALKKVVTEGIPEVVFSTDIKNGHLSTNYALAFAKKMGISPKELAGKIKKELNDLKIECIERIEVAGSGYVNIFLKNKAIVSELEEIEWKIKSGFDFLSGKKINIEFISANPTGELHIGHGRGAFYGDALANIFSFAGAEVTREFYINDSRESKQIQELGKTALGVGETYLTEKLKTQIEKLEMESKDFGEVGFQLASVVQKNNREFMENKLGIKFDVWYSEDEKLRGSLLNDRNLAAFKMKELVYEKDGAIWLKTSEYGGNEDRVVVRSDQTKSYFISDISYHADKFSRGYSDVIDIWGADHHGHVKRMQAVKKMLGWVGEFKIFITQLVSLKEDGITAKMSKRAGNVVLLEDLVDKFGADVVRWFFLEKSLNTHMEFDMALAKEQSPKNPVFYVQYAHARMCSIVEKTKGIRGDNTAIETILIEPSAKNLAIKNLQFSEVIENIVKDYHVHRLTTYVYELAGALSVFYRDVRVAGNATYNTGALQMINTTKKTVAKCLSLLGIKAPEKM